MESASRTQVDAYGNEAAPVPYEALFPSGPSGPSAVPIAPPIAPVLPLNVTRSRSPPNQERDAYVDNPSYASPPPPPPEARPLNAREEKERMRQLYEAQDSAARQPNGTTVNGAPLAPPPHSLLNGSTSPASRSPAPTPTPPAPSNSQPLTAAQEKAMLRARYAAEDAAQNGSGPPPLPPPPRSATASSLPPLPPPPVDMHQSPPPPDFSSSDREMPLPPSFPSATKRLTAAEEKAQLRAKYAAEDTGDSNASSPPSSYFSRPPLPTPNGHAHGNHGGDDDGDGKPEYLRRDPTISRGKRRATDDIPPPPPLPQKPPTEYYLGGNEASAPATGTPTSGSDGAFIDVRPFSPFTLEYDYSSLGGVPPPPPLPPKPIS